MSVGPSSHLRIGKVALGWNCESVEFVRDAETFFAAHNSMGFVAFVVLGVDDSEGLTGVHALPVTLREYDVAADVFVGLVAETVTVLVLNHTENGVAVQTDFLDFGLWLAQVIVLHEYRQILSSLQVGESDFLLLVIIFNLLEEFVQKALFGLGLNLGDDHPGVELEVVARALANALGQWQVVVVDGHLLLGTDHTSDCVALVLAADEVAQSARCEELVDWDVRLAFFEVAKGGGCHYGCRPLN